IVLVVHSLMYMMLPNFYLEEKKEELKNRADELTEKLRSGNESDSFEVAEKFATRYNMNITLQINGEMYRYQGFTPIDIYIDPSIDEDDTIPPAQLEQNESDIAMMTSPQVMIEERTFNGENTF